MKEYPIIFSITTGEESQRGKRLRSQDGLTWKQRNREAVNARRRNLYAREPEKHRERLTRYRKENPEILRLANRRWRAEFWPRLRREFISAYGSQCACCGESEAIFLDLDHTHNDGAAHRREVGNNQRVILELKRTGWPKGDYQLLCCNCNQGKARNEGVCPHQK